MKTLFILAVSIILASSATYALVVEDYNTAEQAPSGDYSDLSRDGVVFLNGSSGVVVDDRWVLTAGHVADDKGSTAELVIDGSTNYSSQIEYHPTADLALVEFASDILPSSYDLYTGTYGEIVTSGHNKGDHRESGAMIGWGSTGVVESTTGYTNPQVSSSKAHRWGSNMIDQRFSSGGEYYLAVGFDTTETTYEAGAAQWDSGGGVFVDDSGTWKLGGIMVNVGDTNEDGDLDVTYAISAQDYSGWINNTVPEPTMAILVGFAGFISLFIYRFRRNYRQ